MNVWGFRITAMEHQLDTMLLRQIPTVLVFVLAGCTTEVDWEVRRGIIKFWNDPVVIMLPDTVTSGNPFTAGIVTYGDGCTRRGQTDAVVQGSMAMVEPFDSVHVAAEVCEAQLTQLLHEVTLTFVRPGAANVQVIGVAEPSDTLIVVNRDLIVQ